MAMKAHQGETHIIAISLEADGEPVSPLSLYNVKAWLVNRYSGEVVEQWSKLPDDTFTPMVVDEEKCYCYCGEGVTIDKHTGYYELQVDTYTSNILMPDGYEKQIEKCILLNLKPAKNVTV
jgi:hypothetical protein